MRSVLPLLAALCLSTAQAHEVRHRIESAQATVVTLAYGNGKPFANERYALFPANTDKPVQTGRTDSRGQVIFLPGETRTWRLQSFAAHGHGVMLDLVVPEPPPAPHPAAAAHPTTPPVTPAPAADAAPNRASIALFGLALLLAGFGLYQLFLRRPR